MIYYIIIIIFAYINAKTMRKKEADWIFIEFAILLYLCYVSQEIGPQHIIPILIAWGITYYLTNKHIVEKEKKEVKQYNYYQRKYINHCWNCKNPINSEINKKCPKCNKYYICTRCDKCKCDSPYYNE